MPIPDAEKLKRRSGCALTALVARNTMEVASIAGRRGADDAAAGAVGICGAGGGNLPPAVGRDSPSGIREVSTPAS
jgi:hypothetical protein